MKIYKISYPTIYEVLNTISHDCGAQAGHSYYEMPHDCSRSLLERELKLLTEEQRQILAIGEETEMEEVSYLLPHGDWVLTMLNQFYNFHLPTEKPKNSISVEERAKLCQTGPISDRFDITVKQIRQVEQIAATKAIDEMKQVDIEIIKTNRKIKRQETIEECAQECDKKAKEATERCRASDNVTYSMAQEGVAKAHMEDARTIRDLDKDK